MPTKTPGFIKGRCSQSKGRFFFFFRVFRFGLSTCSFAHRCSSKDSARALPCFQHKDGERSVLEGKNQ